MATGIASTATATLTRFVGPRLNGGADRKCYQITSLVTGEVVAMPKDEAVTLALAILEDCGASEVRRVWESTQNHE